MTNETAVKEAASTLTASDSEVVTRFPAIYTGEAVLSGITPGADGYVLGEYWEHEGLFLFQPAGSSKIFEVSDEDIRRTSAASAAGSSSSN